MSEAEADDYEALKKVEIEEFYRLLDIWAEQKKQQIDRLTKK